MSKYFIFLFLLWSGMACSQTIRGIVLDENKQPIAGAEIYLDGTSIWTTSNDSGSYELSASHKVNTTLVVYYMGYEKQMVGNPFGQDFITTQLVPKETRLKEVKIVAEGIFKRADKLKVFREQFLGTTKAGKSCKILNEDDLYFFYDVKTDQLIASADVPIKIHNEVLGYDVEFSLQEFYIDFTHQSISSSHVKAWMIMGTTFYKDLTTSKNSYVEARQKCYDGSQMQFYRKLIHRQLGKDNFQLLKRGKVCNPDDYFTITQSDGYYDITVKNTVLKPGESYLQSFTLDHKYKKDSYVVFYTPTFSIDGFGNNDAFHEINFTGEMSKNRAGDLLPWDYRE